MTGEKDTPSLPYTHEKHLLIFSSNHNTQHNNNNKNNNKHEVILRASLIKIALVLMIPITKEAVISQLHYVYFHHLLVVHIHTHFTIAPPLPQKAPDSVTQNFKGVLMVQMRSEHSYHITDRRNTLRNLTCNLCGFRKQSWCERPEGLRIWTFSQCVDSYSISRWR